MNYVDGSIGNSNVACLALFHPVLNRRKGVEVGVAIKSGCQLFNLFHIFLFFVFFFHFLRVTFS